MEYIYAQLDEDGVCVAVSQLASEFFSCDMVRIDALDADLLGMRYSDGDFIVNIDKQH